MEKAKKAPSVETDIAPCNLDIQLFTRHMKMSSINTNTSDHEKTVWGVLVPFRALRIVHLEGCPALILPPGPYS